MKETRAILRTTFATAIALVLLSATAASAFWHGEARDLYRYLDADTQAEFNQCLAAGVYPYLDGAFNRKRFEKRWFENLDDFVTRLSPEGKEAMNLCLMGHILPRLDEKLRLIDNRDGDDGVTIYRPKRADNGYTLLSSILGHGCDQAPPAGSPPFPVMDDDGNQLSPTSCGAILIDMQGEIVKEWPLFAVPAKLLPGGNVLGLSMDPSYGPPVGGLQALMQMDWCGNETWRWPNAPFPIFGGARAHHDFQRQGSPVGYFAPDQESMLFGAKSLVLSMSEQLPLPAPQISNFPLLEDAIYEIGADGEIVWKWHPNEHFDQMGFSEAARFAIKTVSVAGIGGVGGDLTTDWQHLNTASYLGPNRWYDEGDPDSWIYHPRNIIYDSRTANYLGIIARVDHPEGDWESGDIVWRVGPDPPATVEGSSARFGHGGREKRMKPSRGQHARQIGQIIGPHMAHMIPQGLPGAGNIIFFDNGGVAGYGALAPGLPGTYPATFRDYSRIIEFNPNSLEVVWEYRSARNKLRYRGEFERHFYSRLISGVQRLANGNTLITEGANGRVFEVDRRGKIVWEYLHKQEYANGAFGLLGFLPPTAIYRAYRIPAEWVPISDTCRD